MNTVMIVPTGIGAKIGGHSGDANVAARLLASVSDNLFLHPNVVNASDLNEMTPNMHYVEGSTLDLFLDGEIHLRPVKHQNRILVVCNQAKDSMEPVNAARSVLGVNAVIVELKTPLKMTGYIKDGHATGDITGLREFVEQIQSLPCESYDAIAIHTPIDVDKEIAMNYITADYGEKKNNPWGGVEAKLSKLIAKKFPCPIAHAPVEQNLYPDLTTQNFPELSAETNGSHLISVLKGLNRAPRIEKYASWRSFSSSDIDAFVTPLCWGTPHDICVRRNIPIISVHQNSTTDTDKYYKVMDQSFHEMNLFPAKTYLEAVGYLVALKEGINPHVLQRPLHPTWVM